MEYNQKARTGCLFLSTMSLLMPRPDFLAAGAMCEYFSLFSCTYLMRFPLHYCTLRLLYSNFFFGKIPLAVPSTLSSLQYFVIEGWLGGMFSPWLLSMSHAQYHYHSKYFINSVSAEKETRTFRISY